MSSSEGFTRQVAVRTFAAEFNNADREFKEGDDQRSPNFLLLPTGAKANRVHVVGTLTETEDRGSDSEYWYGKVVDPTGAFSVYAGQYEPDAATKALRETAAPAYVSIVGKPNTYEGDDGDVFTSIRPESINVLTGGPTDEVANNTRERWVSETANRTLDRIEQESEDIDLPETDDPHEQVQAAIDEGAMVQAAELYYGANRQQYAEYVADALETLEEEAN